MQPAKGRPHFFVFTQTFTCESEINLDLFLETFTNYFDTLQTNNWLQYWTDHGEAIILDEWKLKYSDYIQDSADSKDTKEQQTVVEEYTANLVDEVHEEDIDFSASWQTLWTDHSTQQYSDSFYKFSTVFNAYFLDLNYAIAPNAEYKSSESDKEEEVEELSHEITSEFEQLKLLGLPTAFGNQTSSKQRKQKKHTNTKFEDFEDFFDQVSSEMPAHGVEEKSESDDEILHRIQEAQKIAKKKKKKNRLLREMPTFMQGDRSLWKYWFRRFSLFSRFDQGIRLDRESWFSVTPEKVATHLAERLTCNIVIDAFCGCGGNAIQFAKTCRKVIAIDIDPIKVEMAKHNAHVYGVANRIDFIVGDFLQLSRSGKFQADLVFLSPPWGGPTYKKRKDFDIEKYLEPVGATELMECARMLSTNIALFLPRNANLQQIIRLAGNGNRCELEHNYLNTRLVALTALYGEEILIKKDPKLTGT